jgi:hypothetical protein
MKTKKVSFFFSAFGVDIIFFFFFFFSNRTISIYFEFLNPTLNSFSFANISFRSFCSKSSKTVDVTLILLIFFFDGKINPIN